MEGFDLTKICSFLNKILIICNTEEVNLVVPWWSNEWSLLV